MLHSHGIRHTVDSRPDIILVDKSGMVELGEASRELTRDTQIPEATITFPSQSGWSHSLGSVRNFASRGKLK